MQWGLRVKVNVMFRFLFFLMALLTFSLSFISLAQQDSGIAEVETATEEARKLKKITGESHWGIGFFGTFFPPITDGGTLGYRFGWSYELPSYAAEIEGRIVTGKNEVREFESFSETNEFGFAAFSVGGLYFFFNNRNISPYLGGGITASRVWWERRTWWDRSHAPWEKAGAFSGGSSFDRGIGAYAVGGIQMLRTTQNRLKLEVRVDKPFFDLRVASDVSIGVLLITVGLSFSWHYIPRETSCFLF